MVPSILSTRQWLVVRQSSEVTTSVPWAIMTLPGARRKLAFRRD